MRIALSLFALAFLLLSGCSPKQPQASDFEKADAAVQQITVSLFESMKNGTEEQAYQDLFDAKTKEKFDTKTLIKISKNVSSKLGSLKSLDRGARSDYDPYQGGIVARVTYVGHFEKGDANIALSAVCIEAQCKIMAFNLNSPLLSENPANYRQRVELYVEDSDFVMPGDRANIVERNSNSKILIEDVHVLNVRWKVSVSNAREGFVTIDLPKEQEIILKSAKTLSIKSKK